MKALRMAWMMWAVLMVAACAGMVAPKNTEQSVAYGYATLAGVRNTTADLLAAGKIKREDAVQVQEIADQARVLLDAAKVASGINDLPTATAKMQLALSVLGNLEAYLKTKGVQ